MLDDIVTATRRRLHAVVAAEGALRERCSLAPPARDLIAALRSPGLSVIAEFKRRSPSVGVIADGDPAATATAYEAGGASALSVLTEPDFFGGGPDDLRRARSATTLPALRKDFTLHPAQVWEGRAMGADAVLAIVALLDDETLASILTAGEEAGVAVLVEAHDAAEVARAAAAGAGVIGVNNRDLSTFEVDVATAERLRGLIPVGTVAVAESGVGAPDTAARMAAAGYDAILVGEAAMRASDPAAFVRALREAA
jgi:indole-3-glycerol phosphate synthase